MQRKGGKSLPALEVVSALTSTRLLFTVLGFIVGTMLRAHEQNNQVLFDLESNLWCVEHHPGPLSSLQTSVLVSLRGGEVWATPGSAQRVLLNTSSGDPVQCWGLNSDRHPCTVASRTRVFLVEILKTYLNSESIQHLNYEVIDLPVMT